MFSLRFDMRAPAWGAPIEDLYAAAIEMASWADGRGALVVVLSEHHGTTDRHLPSPLILASAIAARTETVPILLAALVLPFYEPVRLAEDMAVLDIVSRGRVAYVLGIGHRREEYDHFGLPFSGRGVRADASLSSLRDLLAEVTPSPISGGPQFLIGGGSSAAGRRAGRFGLGLIAQTAEPGIVEAYERACRDAGREPGFVQVPAPGAPTALFVADDPDQAWNELGRHLLHDAMTAASYRPDHSAVASISTATTVEELRNDTAYRVVTVDDAVARLRSGEILPLLPLCGGLPPDVAWPYLHRAAEAVALARG